MQDGVALPHTALALPYGGDVTGRLLSTGIGAQIVRGRDRRPWPGTSLARRCRDDGVEPRRQTNPPRERRQKNWKTGNRFNSLLLFFIPVALFIKEQSL